VFFFFFFFLIKIFYLKKVKIFFIWEKSGHQDKLDCKFFFLTKLFSSLGPILPRIAHTNHKKKKS